ncbi:MAG: hypothetical protein L3J17_03620 [Candidatus Jettenia sp.]|nr:MAG: hypothetical protein L3J17_03620 [Candidatus Jettenia sp.]
MKSNISSTEKDYPPVIVRVLSEAIPKTEITSEKSLAMAFLRIPYKHK